MSDKTAHERLACAASTFAVYLRVERHEAKALLAEHQAVLRERDEARKCAYERGDALDAERASNNALLNDKIALTNENATLREVNARLAQARNEAAQFHSLLHDAATGSHGMHTLLRAEHGCAVDAINHLCVERDAANDRADKAEARVRELEADADHWRNKYTEGVNDRHVINASLAAERQRREAAEALLAKAGTAGNAMGDRIEAAEARVAELQARLDATVGDVVPWHIDRYEAEHARAERFRTERDTERQLRQATESALAEARKERDELRGRVEWITSIMRAMTMHGNTILVHADYMRALVDKLTTPSGEGRCMTCGGRPTYGDFSLTTPCPDCAEAQLTPDERCGRCGGSGEVFRRGVFGAEPRLAKKPCPTCNGAGKRKGEA